MRTLRRLYVYLLSAISLTMLAIGLVQLLSALYEQMGLGGAVAGGSEGMRQQLSVAAALIGVGLPVWLIRWWLAERGLSSARPGAEAERTSPLRSLYLTVALAAPMIAGGLAAVSLVAALIRGALGVHEEYGRPDLSTQLATFLVASLVWIYHAWIRRRDLAAGAMEGAAAWLPRVYLYGAALVGLLAGVQSVADLVTLAGRSIWHPATVIGQPDTFDLTQLANDLATLIAAGVLWAAHWWYGLRLAFAPEWRSLREAESRLRVTFFVVVLIAAPAALVDRLAQGVRALIAGAIGATDSFGTTTGTDVAREVTTAVIVSAVWGATWWMHARWMRSEGGTAVEAGRLATVDRLEWSAPALVGLAYGAVGLGWLAGLLIDIAFGGNRTISGSAVWRAELAGFLALILAGGALWLATWWRMTARFVADPPGEAASTIRRAALILPLAGGIIVGLISLAWVIYRSFGALFGVHFERSAISDLSAPLGALLVATVVAGYYGLLLRNDLRIRAASEAEGLAAPPGAELVPAPAATAVAMPRIADPTALLLEALEIVAPILAAPGLREHWNEPSALAEWSVAGLAGHLVRAPRVLLDYLEAPAPNEAPIDRLTYYDAALPEAFDAADPVHVGIRARGEEFASGGPEALLATFAEARAALAARLPGEREDRRLGVVNGIVIRLGDYLPTRLVELVVHAEDLALSIGLPPPTMKPELSDAVITYLVAVARQRHGDEAVIRALTRRERDSVEALRIF